MREPTTEETDPSLQKWPNLFLVGVARGGTSSLAHAMSQHSLIYMSPTKEPHYFSPARRRLVPGVRDEQAYLRLFAGASREIWRAEASASYFWDEETALAIKKAVPDARILVSLRDPIERAHSHYWLCVRNGTETRPFGEALDAELRNGAEAQLAQGFAAYIDRGFYSRRLERYLSLFDGNVLVLHFEDFAADPIHQLRVLFRFLGVDEEEAAKFSVDRREEFSLPRNRAARRLYASQTLRTAARRFVWPGLRRRLDRAMLAHPGRPPLDDGERRVLAQRYAAERVRLAELLGEKLPWAQWPT